VENRITRSLFSWKSHYGNKPEITEGIICTCYGLLIISPPNSTHELYVVLSAKIQYLSIVFISIASLENSYYATHSLSLTWDFIDEPVDSPERVLHI
jgi:hypothetical protein